MKLVYLPNELLQIVTSYLPRQSISNLCSTCTQGYQIFLPALYKHIELGHRTQIRQLEQGLMRNSYLKETVREHTQILTLKCRQGGNSHWLIITLFEQLPNIKKLYFRDFLSLSIAKVGQALAVLPHLKYLDFQYCNLIATNTNLDDEDDRSVRAKAKDDDISTKKALCNLTELNLMWTDFTPEALRQLLITTPNLSRVVLGANHNKKLLANDSAVNVLRETCHHIKDLSISLQQVKEQSICAIIQKYGSQLEHLSIRCEGDNTIRTISQYTTKLKNLVIRCNSSGYGNVMNILEQCQSLTRLEMVSWPLQDVPTVVLDQIRYRNSHPSSSSSSSSITAPTSSYIEGIKRTVALDKQDLLEIRRLRL